MGTIALDVRERWNAGDRTVSGQLNWNSAGLCPAGRGILDFTTFPGETWVNMTCAASDPVTGSSKRTEFAFGSDYDPRLTDNQYYHFETYFKDYTADASSPNSCNHIVQQFKYGAYYPQLALWVINQSGTLKFQVVRQVSTTPDATTFETQNTHIIGNVPSNTKQVWDYDILWREDNTGHIKIYINGTIVLNLTGIQTMDEPANPANPPIPKFRLGPYCFGGFNSITSRTIFYRRVIIGNNDFADFNAFQTYINGSNPLPPPTEDNTNTVTGIFINE